MRKKVKIGCMTIFTIVVLGLIILAGLNKHETSKRDCLYISATLSKMEKAELKEVFRLQSDFGNKVWPGLERERPIILFNDRYEFLLKASRPPEPWEIVEEDDLFGNPYYRRLADKPQAFAVAVGDQWAGSLGTRDQMNREYLLGARRQLPPFLAPFYPYSWATISWDVMWSSFSTKFSMPFKPNSSLCNFPGRCLCTL